MTWICNSVFSIKCTIYTYNSALWPTINRATLLLLHQDWTKALVSHLLEESFSYGHFVNNFMVRFLCPMLVTKLTGFHFFGVNKSGVLVFHFFLISTIEPLNR